MLLQAGANARQAAVTGVFLGKTPLMWASSQGRTEVVRLLLLAGVDVNYSSHFGNFKVQFIDEFLYLNYFLFLLFQYKKILCLPNKSLSEFFLEFIDRIMLFISCCLSTT